MKYSWKPKTLLNCTKNISFCAFEVMNNGRLNWMVDPSDRMHRFSDYSLCKWVVTTKLFCKYLFLYMSQESIPYWCMWILASFCCECMNSRCNSALCPMFPLRKMYTSNRSYDPDVPSSIPPLFDVNIQSVVAYSVVWYPKCKHNQFLTAELHAVQLYKLTLVVLLTKHVFALCLFVNL